MSRYRPLRKRNPLKTLRQKVFCEVFGITQESGPRRNSRIFIQAKAQRDEQQSIGEKKKGTVS